MLDSLSKNRKGFLRSLYANNKSFRTEALNCIRDYRFSARASFPPRKAIWSKFYAEDRGGYIHKKFGEHLLKRQQGFCCYCRDKIFHRKNCNIEHILPIKHYPMFAFEYKNLAAACLTCNALKSDGDFYKVINLKAFYGANSFTCFHPVLDEYNDHVDFLKIQTNHIYVRVFRHRTGPGQILCSEHLKKVSLFNVKEQANPVVAEVIKKLGEHLDGKPGYESAHSALKRLAANI